MFIYHFNRLIRNRFLWLLFAVIVAFAFLSVDSCVRSPDGGGRNQAGTLGDQTVGAEDLAMAELFVRGGRRQNRDRPPAVVATQAWSHLAAVRTAHELGLTTDADEIRHAIREAPAFSNQGRFDPMMYRQVVAEQLGVPPSVYERLMSDQIALNKLAIALEAAAWVSPMELADETAAWTDRFTLRHVTISNHFMQTDVTLGEDDLRRFYAENRELFALPERVGVHYAILPAARYLQSVTIPEVDIEDYYDANASRFVHTTTNDVQESLPLSEVRDEIHADLAMEEARFMAGTNAVHFVERLGMADPEEFSWRARARGMQVAQSDLFDYYDPPAAIEPDAREDFAREAFDLDPNRLDARFAVVPGVTNVYIVCQWTNSPAHTPDFEAVRDQVLPQALAQAREKAFADSLDELHAALSDKLEAGADFAASAAEHKLNVSTAMTFTAQEIMNTQELPNARTVMQTVIYQRPGELSKPIHVPGGAMLVYLDDRQPGEMLTVEMLRSQVRDALVRRRAEAVFGQWLRANLERIGFEPAFPPADYDETDDDTY